jgi:hypothetical protein
LAPRQGCKEDGCYLLSHGNGKDYHKKFIILLSFHTNRKGRPCRAQIVGSAIFASFCWVTCTFSFQSKQCGSSFNFLVVRFHKKAMNHFVFAGVVFAVGKKSIENGSRNDENVHHQIHYLLPVEAELSGNLGTDSAVSFMVKASLLCWC